MKNMENNVKNISFDSFLKEWGDDHNINTSKSNDDDDDTMNFECINQKEEISDGKRERDSIIWICDYCEQKGFGDPITFPQIGNIGDLNYAPPQGKFCSKSCRKSCAEYELGYDHLASLCDKMENVKIDNAPHWAELEIVKQDGTGKKREDWTGIQDDKLFYGNELVDPRIALSDSKIKRIHTDIEKK